MGDIGEKLFRTTMMGGYDKADVEEGVTKLKDEAYAEKTKLLNTIKERDKQIEELKAKLQQKDDKIIALEKDIESKYQMYVENYESIGRLVFEAQLRADNIIEEANQKKAQIIEKAQAAAQKCLESVQDEVDAKLKEGRKKYVAVQEELNGTVELMNQVQRRFMESCKAVHNIVSTVPESIQDLDDDSDDDYFFSDTMDLPDISGIELEEEVTEAVVDESSEDEKISEEKVEDLGATKDITLLKLKEEQVRESFEED